MNSLPKHVASRTLTDADMRWNSTLLPADDALAGVAALREAEGRDVLVWGSATLVRDLLDAGLVDELRLMIEPVLLGGGKRIFPDGGRLQGLELVSCTPTSTGVLMCTYRAAGA